MSAVLLAARLVLAAVFAVAGAAKLADRRGSRRAVEDFGVPGALAPALAVVLPVVELAVAALLLVRSTASAAAVAGGILLLTFAAVIAANLAVGRSPECHCFGQLHSEPAGWRTFARNGALAAIAGFVAWQGWNDAGASATALVGWARPAELAALAFILVATWFGYQVLKQQGRLLVRVEALEAGLAAAAQRPLVDVPRANAAQGHGVENGHGPRPELGLPIGSAVDFRLPALDGRELALSEFRGRRVVLVHWSPQCGFCDMIAPELAALERDLRKRNTELVFVSYGDAAANRTLAEEHGLRAPILLHDGPRLEAFEGLGTPAAYLLDEEGNVARPLALGAKEVPVLVREVAKSGKKKAGSKTDVQPLLRGAPAPLFTLPSLDGGDLSIASYRGRRVLLVFSDPQCGACDEVAAELAGLERAHRDNGVAFVAVGRGDEDANREKARRHGIEFPYALQRQWTVAEAYGTYATPAAFLIDERGTIARDVALGTTAILELAREAEAVAA